MSRSFLCTLRWTRVTRPLCQIIRHLLLNVLSFLELAFLLFHQNGMELIWKVVLLQRKNKCSVHGWINGDPSMQFLVAHNLRNYCILFSLWLCVCVYCMRIDGWKIERSMRWRHALAFAALISFSIVCCSVLLLLLALSNLFFFLRACLRRLCCRDDDDDFFWCGGHIERSPAVLSCFVGRTNERGPDRHKWG